ncbi:uncharacterized protein DC041_0005969 [Schistosoma bovis]|uniref:Uncharacterized protein n=1 Tax=Schistosoma bovis TaxID=6184 RepID=A0A430QQQ4_SCHBO|nr:uncharacterized protein DC041_0005969 [Schistosoma bovis]
MLVLNLKYIILHIYLCKSVSLKNFRLPTEGIRITGVIWMVKFCIFICLVVERLDYLSDVLELPSLNCKPNLKRIINLLTTTVQPEVLGPMSRYKLLQMKQKLVQCGKAQNKLEQHRKKTQKQMNYFNSYSKVPRNMNVS